MIAHVAFWVLLIAGRALGELSTKAIAIFVVLWLAGLFGLRYVAFGTALFMALTALLDVVLVLLVFKGDIRIR